MDQAAAKVVKRGNKWVVLSKSGKQLGSFSTKQEAVKRLGQIEFFKDKGKGNMTRQTDADILAQALGKPKVTDHSSVKNKPTKVSDDPAGGRTKTDLASGTVAGMSSKRVIDGKSHFPVDTENRARSAVSRVMRLRSAPDWFMGSVAELRDLVKAGVAERHPNLSISVAVAAEQVLDGFSKAVAAENQLVGGPTGELKVDEIKNPGNVNPKEVPGVPTPSLKSVGQDEFKQAVATNRAIAESLPEMIEKKIENLKQAKELALRLLDKGLTGEEFGQMWLFLQEDVLRELMLQGVEATVSTESRMSDLLAKMDGADAAKPDFLKKKDEKGKKAPPFMKKKK